MEGEAAPPTLQHYDRPPGVALAEMQPAVRDGSVSVWMSAPGEKRTQTTRAWMAVLRFVPVIQLS